MNAQIVKDGNNTFCLHNWPNRIGVYLAEFSPENKIVCLNTKFQKKKESENDEFTSTRIALKNS